MIIDILLNRPTQVSELIAGTPKWTWGLLAVLVFIGILQLRERSMTKARAWTISLVLAGFGLAGLIYSFRNSTMLALSVLGWVAVSLVGMSALSRLRVGVVEGPVQQTDGAARVKGSVVPLALIVAAFATRYLATLEIAVNPSALQDSSFVIGMGMVYGLISGGFLARARGIQKEIER